MRRRQRRVNDNRVAIYCRLSVEDMTGVGDESESIRNQKLLLVDYAMERGWSIHKVYVDDSYSGLDRNRPQFNKMIADARAGLFNIVLCKHQSRFTRDLELVEKYIHGLFVVLGIRFVSVIDNIDTDVKGNKKARQIYALINEWYVEDLSENIRAVFRKKMEAGQFLGAFAAYGYMKDPVDRHRLIVDAEAAAVVREIYALYLQGYGYRYIRDLLTAREVPTPAAYKKAKGLNFAAPNCRDGTSEWANNTIKRILTNRVYIGCLIQGREKKLSYKSRKVALAPESEWVVIEHNHEPIISETDFCAVQELIASKRISREPGVAAHLFAGKAYCLHCGGAMHKSARTRDGKSFYLRCGRHARTRRAECRPNYIRLDFIANEVEHRLREHVASVRQCCFFEKLTPALVNRFVYRVGVGEKEIAISWRF